MNPLIFFTILRTNAADLLAIEQKIGGLSAIIKLEPQLFALYQAYAAGGLQAVLRNGGANVQAIIEAIGPANIAAVLPHAGNILKTLQGSAK
jgi:hypothetical protein